MTLNPSAFATPLEMGYQQGVYEALQLLVQRIRGNPRIDSDQANETIGRTWRFELGALLSLSKEGLTADQASQRAIWEFLSGLVPTLRVQVPADSALAFNEHLVSAPYHTIEGSLRQVRLVAGSAHSPTVRSFYAVGNPDQYCWVSDATEHIIRGDWFSARLLHSPCPLGAASANHQDALGQDGNLVADRMALDDSLAAVDRFAPEYKRWVGQLTRCIILAPRFGRGSKSTSFFSCPGHFHLSAPASVPYGVVTLVHECAHQHYHLASRILQFSSADASAYSAIKGTHRPVDKVLLGFHAFANALIALEMMFDRGYRDADFDRVHRGTAEYVAGLADTVRALHVPDITPHGQSLISALLGRIGAQPS